MATYVVGDVQGCFLTFQRLLHDINFDESADKVILLGDAINRGQHSLEMLRFLKRNSSSMEMILGNHEIFAIALFLGAIKTNRAHTLQALFAADDGSELIDWLRGRPLLRKYGSDLFVHAGILPAVTIENAIKSAEEVSSVLQSGQAKKFLRRYYEKTPTVFKPTLRPRKALRLTLAYLTLMRMCEAPTSIDLSYTGTLDRAPKRLKPWFFLRNDHLNIYFGHWAALGVFQRDGYYCLDSGCVWGNKLSALRLSDKKLFQVQNCEET